MSLPIPPIPPDLVAPVRTLLDACRLYHDALVDVVKGTHVPSPLASRKPALRAAEKALRRWSAHPDLCPDAPAGQPRVKRKGKGQRARTARTRRGPTKPPP